MNFEDKALIVFVKNPVRGYVKTRLAKTIGDDRALAAYFMLLEYTRNIALKVNAHRYIYYSHFIDHNDLWSAGQFSKALQTGDDLGARMANAFQDVLKKHKKAVIIGSDCAELTPDIVISAYEALDHYPLTIGPALDGGYYLLGMEQYHRPVFEHIDWSTSSVFQQTINKANDLGLSFFLLPTLSDIDDEADWLKTGWALPD